jgi:hypothetical protein
LFYIDDDAARMPFATAENQIDEELQRTESLSTVPDDETSIFALDVDYRQVVGATSGTADGWSRFDAQRVEEVTNHAETCASGTIVVGYQTSANLGRFGTDAEDSRPAYANDVDFYFVAVDAELEGHEFYRFFHRLRCPD